MRACLAADDIEMRARGESARADVLRAHDTTPKPRSWPTLQQFRRRSARAGSEHTMTDKMIIRIGILADSVHASKYVHDLVSWAKSQSGLAITHLLVHPSPVSHPISLAERSTKKILRIIASRGIYAAMSRKIFKGLILLEKLRLKKESQHRDHDARFDLRELIPETVLLSPEVSGSGLSYRFNEADINHIRSLDFDVLIRSGGGILRGKILSAARFGVVSFHHADNRINRGTPAGFWEVYHRQGTTGFTLQRLDEELDGGQVLMRGHFPTRHYYLLNQASLFEKSNYYLKTLLAKLASSGTLPSPIPSIPYYNQLFRAPLFHQCAAYISRSALSILSKRIRKLRRYSEYWQVSFVRSGWRNAVLWRGTGIPNPPGGYLADPFLVSRNGKDYCFVEEYDRAESRGRISVYEIGLRSAERLGVVIDESFHLSFPFVFEYDNALYMSPESSANRDIRIYRCVDFPMRWELERIVMSEVSAVDTMFFERGGRWWMFTNIDPANIGEHCSELFIFSSSSPLAISWRAHSLNPVLVDASCARNGGLLHEGARVFRVSQRQGFDRYGKGSQINEIVELSDDVYKENCIAKIDPLFAEGLLGTHHLHSANNVTVFDSLACGPSH
jgi:hypothetical protein